MKQFQKVSQKKVTLSFSTLLFGLGAFLLAGCEEKKSLEEVDKTLVEIAQGNYPSLISFYKFYKRSTRLEFLLTGRTLEKGCDDFQKRGAGLLSLIGLNVLSGASSFKECIGEGDLSKISLLGRPKSSVSLSSRKASGSSPFSEDALG